MDRYREERMVSARLGMEEKREGGIWVEEKVGDKSQEREGWVEEREREEKDWG